MENEKSPVRCCSCNPIVQKQKVEKLNIRSGCHKSSNLKSKIRTQKKAVLSCKNLALPFGFIYSNKLFFNTYEFDLKNNISISRNNISSTCASPSQIIGYSK